MVSEWVHSLYGAVRVERYVSVADVGRAINPLTLEGQDEGGVVQGLGHTLLEEMLYADGHLLNGTLLVYRVPRADDAPAELEWVRQLTQRLSRPVTDLSGRLDLKQLGAWIGAARAFIGVDSVPMHLAAAQGVPSVALFGPSGDVEWGPWQVAHRVVTTPFSCRPCGQDGCGGSKVSDCLMAIEARDVLSALDELTAAGR